MKKICLIFLFSFVTHTIYSQDFFKTTEEYIDNTVEKTGFDRDKIFIVNSSNHDFVKDVINNQLFAFLGIVNNSEFYSASELDIPSCWGQFLELYKSVQKGDVSISSKKIVDISYLKDLPLENNKKIVVFIYLSDMKKRHVKNTIHPILNEIKKDSTFDYIVLSMDYNRIINH